MTTYIGQLSNRIEINKRKLSSLEEYKETLLASKENIDKELLADRLEQIDIEFSRLKKSIHANKKAIAHYEAAYNHLIDLRSLDNELQLAHSSSEKESLEQEIIEHTNKLQKHLSILPEKLVNELQESYRQYVEANPITPVIPSEEAGEPTGSSESLNDFTNSMIYLQLLEIFEAEKKEFNDIKVFNNPESLEKFLDKYRKMKMDCYTSLAVLNSIGDKVNVETITSEIQDEEQDGISIVEENTDENETSEVQPSKLPIITMLALVDGLEISKSSAKKLHPTNIKTQESFKEELKNGNWLYNVIHLAGKLVRFEDIDFSDFMSEVTNTEINKKRIEVLKDRINSLPKTDLISIYNEYYSLSNTTSLPTALQVLISENVEKLA